MILKSSSGIILLCSFLKITVNYCTNILLMAKILSSVESTFKRHKMSKCTGFLTSEQLAGR